MIALRLLQIFRSLFSVSGILLFFSLRSILRPIGIIAIIGTIILLPLIFLSKNLLTVEVPMAKADIIVVLGGESSQRVIGAAEMYHAGRAPYLFVSGEGDCMLIVRRLVMAGVPMSRIGYECRSRNTRENALVTRLMLSKNKPRRVLLVTSWYHSRRALSVFKNNWKGVRFGMHVTYPGKTLKDYPSIYESGFALSEYAKIIKYKLSAWWPF